MLMGDAVQGSLVENGKPAVTGYGLFVVLHSLCRTDRFQGHDLEVKRAYPNRYDYRRVVSWLLKERFIRPDVDFFDCTAASTPDTMARSHVFRVNAIADGSAEEITGIVDPFCYISHMSAMQRYGLTNRIPEALMLSTPKQWKDAAHDRMQRDYCDIQAPDEYRFPLSRIGWPDRIRQRPIACHTSQRAPVLRDIRDSHARISAIGETFVQMLDRPELCGGMSHVVEVWQEHAKTYLREIIPAVERAPERLVKLRAGYLLDERLGVRDPTISSWKKFAQPGGSQLLDPVRPYVSRRSETWKISLNV